MKLFPKKLFQFLTGGGANGISMSTGTDAQSDAFSLSQTRSMGTDAQSMTQKMDPTLAIGTQTESMAATASVTAAYPQGTDGQSMAFSLAQSRDTGTDGASMVVNATADLTQYTTTGDASINPDPPAWTNPTNAQGNFDGTEASHAGSPPLPSTDSAFDATLRCSGLIVPTTPSGFTRTGAKIRLRHRWALAGVTLPVAGIKDVTMQIRLLDSANALISTLSTRTASGGGGTQSTLLTEEFDINGLVTNPQLAAGIKIDCRFFTTGAIVNATDPCSWNVDGCHLVGSYSRSGIT